jgi:hypothetical protein
VLHRINPVCTDQFTWVADLQRKLLEAVCADVTPQDVTTDWLCIQVSSVNKTWFEKFVEQKDKVANSNQSILQNLKILAGANQQGKQTILAIYRNNRELAALYQTNTQSRIRKVTELGNAALQAAYRGFTSSFYDPVFYAGYPTTSGNLPDFNREKLVVKFIKDNDIAVCVLCDMDLNDPDVDHFFSKKEFPELACHPANLVPICKSCNGRARKGEKAPLDFEEAQQCEKWFHPYYRQIDWDDVSICFDNPDGSIRPSLSAQTLAIQQRLDKLESLIGLGERWDAKLNHIFRTTIKKLKQARYAELRDKLQEWADSKDCEVRLESSAILHAAFLHAAADNNQNILNKLQQELMT